MRVSKPTELLETFVVCTEKALFLKELHRDGPTTRELAQHRWVTLLIPLPVTFTQCVRCKTVCLGAKRI
ncbi:hypothetical protein T4A_13056 [Trichinella pseudospiralis]|uniref:Uncharacterized protein n=1 Tax=Trichinella pseudospiralis TaxID=6337 RepID=A0A0V1EB95_TRIPS|nr:hypothetical protein T4A_13056 [Trichinella pseudospiralis]